MTDVLVVAAFEGDSAALGAAFDGAAAGRVAAALESREFTGKAGTIFVTPCASPGWRPARLMLVGAGSRSGFDTAELRRAAAAAALASREKRWRRVAFVLPAVLPLADEAQAAAEGLTLAAHYSGIYKSDADAKPVTIESLIAIPEQASAEASTSAERSAARGYILAACSNLARALANEPANVITPRAFAEIAVQVAEESGLKADVLDEDRLAGLNMGLLLGVARGSAERPRMVVLRYEPARPATRPSWGSSAKASPSTRGASPSSRPTACTS